MQHRWQGNPTLHAIRKFLETPKNSSLLKLHSFYRKTSGWIRQEEIKQGTQGSKLEGNETSNNILINLIKSSTYHNILDHQNSFKILRKELYFHWDIHMPLQEDIALMEQS